eukprot:UN3470
MVPPNLRQDVPSSLLPHTQARSHKRILACKHARKQASISMHAGCPPKLRKKGSGCLGNSNSKVLRTLSLKAVA